MRFRALGVFALLLLSAVAASADNFEVNPGGGNWSNNATWTQNGGPASRFPGQLVGTIDTVNGLVATFFTVTVDVLPAEAVTLNFDCPSNTSTCVFDVASGGGLILTGSSNVGADARLKMTGGGAITNNGTLTLAATSNFDWTNGTLTGTGVTAVNFGANVNATGSSMVLSNNHDLNIAGVMTYGPSASNLQISSGAVLTVQSGGLLDIQNSAGIGSTGGGSIAVLSGGIMAKTQGNFGTNITPPVNNQGTVRTDINMLVLTNGTSNGTFNMNGAGTGFGFSGTPTFQNGTAITGIGTASLGNVTITGTVSATNLSMDSFASIGGSGTLNLSGILTWQGGSINGIILNALSPSTVNITGTGNTSLASAAHLNNQGTLTINPGATFSIVSDAHLTNDGLITIPGDLTIAGDGAPLSRIDNLATRSFSKTAGAGTTSVNVKLNNAGNVSATQGLLKLQKGGTHSGGFNLGTSAALAFDGGTHQFTGGTFSGSTGTVALTAGIMDVDAGINIPSGLTFQQAGGTLTGSANFLVLGPFLWTGGTMDNSSGGGQTILGSSSAQIASTTSTLVLSGRTLSNTGSFTYNPTAGIELSIDNGGHFSNTGTFNWVGDAEIDSNGSGTPKLTNSSGGAINKSTGTGVADLFASFNSSSSINLSSGSIALHGGGSDLGTVNFGGAANKIIIANGTFSLTAQPGLNGGGAISVDGPFATLGLSTAVTIPRMELLGGGTVAGGTLGIGTDLLWRNGKMLGGVTNIGNTATVDATSLNGPITLDGHSLTNNGTFNWNGTTQSLVLTNGSSLINNGTFEATGAGSISGSAPSNAITNNGTFRKTGGASGTTINPAFVNNGTLSSEVSGQSLIIIGGGSQTGGGTLSTTSGALLDFFGGTFTVPAGTSPFSGSGIFRVNGGTLSITGNTSVPSPAVLVVDGGTLNVAASTTFQIFAGLQWNGGNLSGDGTTRTFGGSMNNASAKALNNNHTLSVAAGSFNYNGVVPNVLNIGGTANFNIENSATLVMGAGTAIIGTSADGLTLGFGATLDTSAGTSTVNSGTMSGGTIATGASGRLDFGNGSFAITGGTVTGTGTIGIVNATLTVNASITFPNLVTGGTLAGSGALLVKGGEWKGGTMTGAGMTTIDGSATFAINSGTPKTLDRNFTNNGTVTENDGFTFTGSAAIANTGTWNSLAGTPMACSACTGKFHNSGTYTKGGPFVSHAVRFDNDGQFTINPGAIGLNLGGGGTSSGDFATNTGNFHVNGATTFSATSDITGNGTVQFSGTVMHQGTLVLGNGGVNGLGVVLGGTTTFNSAAPVQAPKMNISGNIAGSANIIVNGPTTTNWTDGTIGGTGTFTVAAGAPMTITSAGGQTLNRNLGNAGTLTLSASVAGSGQVTNTGTLKVQGGPALATFAPAVANQGLAEFLANSIDFTGGYSQSAGTTKLAGGTFSSPLTVNITGGSLVGNGTITGNVTSSATIAPGFSAGAITIAGNLTLNAASLVTIDISGTTPATQHDQLVVTGNAALNGTLTANFIGGFTPADDDTFDVVVWNAHSGTFSTVNLPAFPSGTLTGAYDADSFTITADFVGDLALTKSGPATAAFGSNVSFTISVTNSGPSPANGVVVNDPTPTNLTFVGTAGDCITAFPCALGTIASGATKTITATYTVTGGAGTNITNTADVTTTTTDNLASNNIDGHTFFVELADVAITKIGPIKAKPGDDITFTITVANGGASQANGVVVNDPTPAGLNFLSNSGACTTPFPCSLGNMASGSSKTITAKYSVSGSLAGSSVTNTATVTATTSDDPGNNTANAVVVIECLNSAPESLSPTTTGGTSGKLSWNGRGDSYIVYFGPEGSGCSTQFATTTAESVPYSNLEPGKTYEWRVESLVDNCPVRVSACVKFTVPIDCQVPPAPVVSVVGQTTSAKTYEVQWDAVPGATRYELDEATNADFLGATRFTVTGTSKLFKHDVTEATAFFYRVSAFVDCVATPGPSSTTVRVVIIPLPPKGQQNPSVNVPAGSEETIIQQVFIPGVEGQNLFFTAATDRPWLTVRPEQGVLPPAGVNLEVFADPKTLPNGTFTASIIVTVTDGSSSKLSTNGTTTVTVPLSVNLVTPITPVAAKPAASQHALIIPTAGHLGGIDSHWQSDIRVTNAGFKSARYKLTFTPSGGTALGVKETTINVDAGATTALDDIIRNWFGLGTLNDGVNGMLEILPLDDPANTIQSTVASSRTYNVSGNGTLGQYIPAVPFPSFIGKALPNALPKILSLQQVAQNAQYRTNVGLAEAAGLPVSAVVSVFNAAGVKLTDIPVQLAAGEQRQMNQLLAQNNIELNDGRIEVKVTGGDGKVTAYASVVDSATQDPLLVTGQLLSGSANKFVLPGVANLDNAVAHWRTDMRVFNYATTSQPATLTFFPFNNGPSKTAAVLIGAGQIMTLDNILRSQFEMENTGGVVHLSTPNAASLVVTGRTYNQTDNGTFGQYVPAVTVDQAVAANGRTLHILQVEDSTRYRTNVGLAEVTGKPATVELQIVLPDSKITPTVQIPLAANEFRQFNVIRELSLGNVYNARITVRVIGGDGRVTAYGSVIDEVTQDPTYVPAQ